MDVSGTIDRVAPLDQSGPHRASFFTSFWFGPAYLVAEMLSFCLALAIIPFRFRNAATVIERFVFLARVRLAGMINREWHSARKVWHHPEAPRLDRESLSRGQKQVEAYQISVWFYAGGWLCLLGVPILCLYGLCLVAWLETVRGRLFTDEPQTITWQVIGYLGIYHLGVSLMLCLVTGGYFHLFQVVRPGVDDIMRLHHSRREIVEAFEIERRRIERDLHDGAQQYLVAGSMKMGEAALYLDIERGRLREVAGKTGENSSTDGSPSESGAKGEPLPPAQTTREQEDTGLDQAARLLEQAQDANEQALRALRRTVAGVHPKVLSDRGLAEAVRDVCAESPVQVDLHLPYQLPSLPPGAAAAAYYFICEALTNIAKYVERPAASVLIVAGSELSMTVIDNGGGGAQLIPGRGLSGLRARLQAFGGELTLHSPLGGPTTLRARMPIIVEPGGLPTGR